jgi:sec-independent protein translocase protein TatA
MSFGHLVVVLFILLLIFGPTRLESIGTSLGKGIRGFKKGLEDSDEKLKIDNDKKKIDTIEEV